MDSEITNVYGNRVRVRVCGLCWQGNNLLLVNHKGLGPGDFWAPPGGGLELGETVEDRLKKEFLEETGLEISPGKFLFGCQFIQTPLHAIELFFEVSVRGGVLQSGNDPEIPIIQEVRFISPADIARIPDNALHGIFRLLTTPGDLKTLSGFFRI